MNISESNAGIPVWGGMECTINRVGDEFKDQLEYAGYYEKNYLKDITGLGFHTIRFPVLWEKHQPCKHKDPSFTWASGQLKQLANAGINVIIGLMHHGSGPAYTNLLDPQMPELLAAYAAKVAAAFPWVDQYTPVNEPLTTARFSGLYGYWYPHKTNDVSFIKMLLNQLKGTVLSMQAIRKINPAARLIQTEDLAKTFSTPLLAYQAEFENHRRWLTYDILCGRFNESHPLWNYFERLGISSESLYFFIDNPCPPQVLGLNYYVTSERYLDDDITKYPASLHGGNGIHTYADIEAIRMPVDESGPALRFKEAWERYHIPIAITEVHLHCSREEQLRWFRYVYDAAQALKNTGASVEGVTAWALLGSYGWNKLLTTDINAEYETGAYDISSGRLRITALGSYLKKQSFSKSDYAYITDQPGWWQTDRRFLHQPLPVKQLLPAPSAAPLLILGRSGTLGKAFANICRQRNISFHLLGREDLDICRDNIETVLQHYKPWAVINATGYVDVDNAEIHPGECELVNSTGALNLAIACRNAATKLVSFSSDLVFDGKKNEPYIETDTTAPLNVYGNSKVLAERFIESVYPEALIIRTSAFFGPWDKYNFLTRCLSQLLCDEIIEVAADRTVSPTYVPHLVHACLNLLIDGESGIWHLANKGQVTWHRFAVMAAAHYHIEESNIIPVFDSDGLARRPYYSALGSTKYMLMPTLDQALDEYYFYKAGPVLTT